MLAAFCHWLVKPPDAAGDSGTWRNASFVVRSAYVSSALKRSRNWRVDAELVLGQHRRPQVLVAERVLGELAAADSVYVSY